MKSLFDEVSQQCSKSVTQIYSTSFSLATRMLAPSIRNHIYNIYGFVRFADEIVDSFHSYPKTLLLDKFEEDLYLSLEHKISLNPILNSFQHTVHKFDIGVNLIEAFLKSMRWDLNKQNYNTVDDYNQYIYGSADVVGLMCLKVFVNGSNDKYESLKPAAMALGSAFQKVNFLRDLKADLEDLQRSYFPNVDFTKFDEVSKHNIIEEIEDDFNRAYDGIFSLPHEAKFGVYTAYKYYTVLLKKLKSTPSMQITNARVRVSNYKKVGVLAQSYIKFRFNLL